MFILDLVNYEYKYWKTYLFLPEFNYFSFFFQFLMKMWEIFRILRDERANFSRISCHFDHAFLLKKVYTLTSIYDIVPRPERALYDYQKNRKTKNSVPIFGRKRAKKHWLPPQFIPHAAHSGPTDPQTKTIAFEPTPLTEDWVRLAFNDHLKWTNLSFYKTAKNNFIRNTDFQLQLQYPR